MASRRGGRRETSRGGDDPPSGERGEGERQRKGRGRGSRGRRPRQTPGAGDVERIQLENAARQQQFWTLFSRVTSLAQKAFVWSLFFLLLWLLRDFFTLIFLTFVFCFICTSLVHVLGRPLPQLGWKPRVVVVYVGFLFSWLVLGWLMVPQMKAGAVELKTLVSNFPSDWRDEYEPQLLEHAWYRNLLDYLRTLGAAESPTAGDVSTPTPEEAPAAREAPLRGLLELPILGKTVKSGTEWLLRNAPPFITDALSLAAGLLSLLFLSTLFSFLIVLDLQNLQSEVRKLERTRLSTFYKETGRNVVKFGEVVGKVLEGQAIIALCNTILTAAGLWMFGLPYIPFLSLVVFICGFIPVAGVFISSAPICVVGLQAGGPIVCLLLVVFVIVIHFIEAYFLNPRIMGAKLKVNPVLILVILVVGHHLIGVWGLLLGLPLAYYFFTHVIKREHPQIRFFSRPDRDRRELDARPAGS